MSFTHTFTREWSGGTGTTPLQDTDVVSSGAEINLSESIPGASTDLLVALALDVSQIQGIYIKCDRDITLETNSGSAPGNTISLKAGKALIWSVNCGFANPLTVDVTALYVTLGSGVAATLEARFLVDPTV
jgi:hypothetical protein